MSIAIAARPPLSPSSQSQQSMNVAMSEIQEEILCSQPVSNLCTKFLADMQDGDCEGRLVEEEKLYMCMIPAAEYGVALERKVEVELPDEVVKGWKEGRFKLLFVKI